MKVIEKVLSQTQKKSESVLKMSTFFSLYSGISIHGTHLEDSLFIPKIFVKIVQLWLFFLGKAKNFLNDTLSLSLPLSTYIYIYIYILCHPQTDCFVVSQLFSMARHARGFKLGSKPGWLYVSQISYLRAIIILSISEGIFLKIIFTYTLSATRGLNSWEELETHWHSVTII